MTEISERLEQLFGTRLGTREESLDGDATQVIDFARVIKRR